MNDHFGPISITEFSKDSFGEGTHFIVDVNHALPAGKVIKWGYCLTDVTGFSCTDLKLISGSGVYPVDLIAGVMLPADLQTITITDGSILCYIG